MSTVARVGAGVFGAALVLVTLVEAMKTVVVPRAVSSFTARFVFIGVRRVFDAVVPARRGFDARDRALAFYAPVALLLLPGLWVALVLVGFAFLYWGTGLDPLSQALTVSGSSVTTLGFARDDVGVHTALSVLEALLGLGIIALMISYLPTIYGTFGRRELLVSRLEARAGSPPSPGELFTRAGRILGLDDLDDLFVRWEEWFVDVGESHTSLPMLVFFRSPQPDRNWVIAAGCILDTAALYTSTVVRDRPTSQAQIMIRSGYLSLRGIADYFGIPYDDDPAPTDPISVERHEFDAVCAEIAAAGVPVKLDRDQAWRDFAGWRVNYDTVLVGLAKLVTAPPAPWSSDRPGPVRRPRVLRPEQVHGRAAPRGRGRTRSRSRSQAPLV